MSDSLRLWKAYPLDGFAALVGASDSEHTRNDFQSIGKRSLVAEWNPVELRWHHDRKSDKRRDIDNYCGAPCFRKADLARLFPEMRAGFEFLPMHLGDEEWAVLNCFSSADSFDRQSADLWIPAIPDLPEFRHLKPTINEIRWINVIEPQALAERWEALGVPASNDPMPYRHLLLTDVFVNRVRELNLRGLGFKHVGYIVADASQVVPKPAAPPAPPPTSSKRKPPKLTAGPLPAAEQIEIAEAGAACRKRLRLAADASAEATLQRLTEEMQTLRPAVQSMSAEERIEASLGLLSILGELLRTACGWSWAELRQGRSQRWIAMLAPSGQHVLPLLPYVQQQMQAEAPTVNLLFNMIVAGNLPAVEPGQLVSVG
jgi:hypothetical protein